ncbi:iron-containing alcohol dehydrogenase [Oleidesulfovibrio sp.]|uniref:iron-containing alcohol dehydrogenase n=1 Tax=Oleidesulfovibrio sp. TaxID=2909707 RepID=UPI003A83F654
MSVTKFAIPEVIFGNSSLRYLGQCALRLGARRIFLVSDPGLEDAGWVQRVINILSEDKLECIYFNEVDSNPRDWQVHKGAQLYNEEHADLIIGLGGGSPIDAAKGIATIASNGGRIRDYEGANRIMRPLPPMIFIPTTAGSGSDISQFCIITDVERQLKMSIISRSLVPNVSIIDPSLLLTKTSELIIASAVDALAHAVESYVSKLASPFTETQALFATSLIMENLEPAARTRDPMALEKLSIASTAAGMSFSNAGLGIGHALAHSLGGRFDVLHGLVHPVLLPHVMRYNMKVCPAKMERIASTVLGSCTTSGASQALAGIERLESLFESLGVTTKLREILPDDSQLEEICKMAVPDECALTNPREATWVDLMGICKEAW